MSDRGIESEAFSSRQREREAQRLGMWIFLVSESLIFGPFIMAYLVSRWHFPEGFAHASAETSLWLATANTAVLLTSSLTMAMADIRAEEEAASVRRWLAITAFLGAAFLCIKLYEWYLEYKHGLVPFLGLDFEYQGPEPHAAVLFYRTYFALTGLHALHLGVGIALIAGAAVLWPRITRDRRPQRVTAFALYWHLIDVLWVFLFAFFYLPGLSL